MVERVMTRQEFYAKYPAFARLEWGSAERKAWLAAHPGAAAQWEAIRDVEQRMVQVYGENWRDTAGEQWFRAVADYLDGGFGNNSTASAPGTAGTAGGTTSSPTGGGSTPAAPTYDRNAYQQMVGLFESFGLGSLAPKILEFAQQGYTNDTIEILLRQTPEFQARFPALKARQDAGLNAISIGRYLELESEYQKILSQSGLPVGFYDDKVSDFAGWIAGDVDPDEIRERVAMAQQAVLSSDPSVRQQLAAYYNLGDGDLLAYFLDPQRATKMFDVRRTFGTAVIGGEAARQGLTVDQARAQSFYDRGINQQQAAAGFANVSATLKDAERLSAIYDGADVGQTELEDEFLGGNAQAKEARTKLVGKEVANFAGTSGVMKSSLRKKNKGQY